MISVLSSSNYGCERSIKAEGRLTQPQQGASFNSSVGRGWAGRKDTSSQLTFGKTTSWSHILYIPVIVSTGLVNVWGSWYTPSYDLAWLLCYSAVAIDTVVVLLLKLYYYCSRSFSLSRNMLLNFRDGPHVLTDARQLARPGKSLGCRADGHHVPCHHRMWSRRQLED